MGWPTVPLFICPARAPEEAQPPHYLSNPVRGQTISPPPPPSPTATRVGAVANNGQPAVVPIHRRSARRDRLITHRTGYERGPASVLPPVGAPERARKSSRKASPLTPARPGTSSAVRTRSFVDDDITLVGAQLADPGAGSAGPQHLDQGRPVHARTDGRRKSYVAPFQLGSRWTASAVGVVRLRCGGSSHRLAVFAGATVSHFPGLAGPRRPGRRPGAGMDVVVAAAAGLSGGARHRRPTAYAGLLSERRESRAGDRCSCRRGRRRRLAVGQFARLKGAARSSAAPAARTRPVAADDAGFTQRSTTRRRRRAA